jgi:hypothetical protein
VLAYTLLNYANQNVPTDPLHGAIRLVFQGSATYQQKRQVQKKNFDRRLFSHSKFGSFLLEFRDLIPSLVAQEKCRIASCEVRPNIINMAQKSLFSNLILPLLNYV